MKIFVEIVKSLVFGFVFNGMVLFASWLGDISYFQAIIPFVLGFLFLSVDVLSKITGIQADIKNALKDKINWIKGKVTQ